MVISRTPYRISFFGGGTDYPAWYRVHGGAVLSTTIDKYCYLTTRYLPPYFEHRTRIVYSKVEHVQSIGEIEHPSVRECLKMLRFDRGLEVHHDGDLPARSGMGSSSAFTVGLLHSLHALRGKIPGREQLATEALCVEQERIKEAVGSQDQISAAFGGLNLIAFSRSGAFSVIPVTIPAKRIRDLNAHLMLFYTGIKRTAANIASTFVNDLLEKERHLMKMRRLVDDGLGILNSETSLDEFGHLMDEGWQLKRGLSSKISNPTVDLMYQAAKDAGALGGKLTGAGGGGFLLLYVRPSQRNAVKERLKGLIHVPFEFEHRGSHIVFYDPQKDYAAEDRHRIKLGTIGFRELDGTAESY